MKALDYDISTLEKDDLIQALTDLTTKMFDINTYAHTKEWYRMIVRVEHLVELINNKK